MRPVVLRAYGSRAAPVVPTQAAVPRRFGGEAYSGSAQNWRRAAPTPSARAGNSSHFIKSEPLNLAMPSRIVLAKIAAASLKRNAAGDVTMANRQRGDGAVRAVRLAHCGGCEPAGPAHGGCAGYTGRADAAAVARGATGHRRLAETTDRCGRILAAIRNRGQLAATADRGGAVGRGIPRHQRMALVCRIHARGGVAAGQDGLAARRRT